MGNRDHLNGAPPMWKVPSANGVCSCTSYTQIHFFQLRAENKNSGRIERVDGAALPSSPPAGPWDSLQDNAPGIVPSPCSEFQTALWTSWKEYIIRLYCRDCLCVCACVHACMHACVSVLTLPISLEILSPILLPSDLGTRWHSGSNDPFGVLLLRKLLTLN
uniref:Uncharacterized protein n=1 Tax=Scleropages formosus TaxID=113540 RepID=A0A8C9S3P3_SCLFO